MVGREGAYSTDRAVAEMRILAIDPGYTMSAWCVLDGKRVETGKDDNDNILRHIRFNDYKADRFAIETIAGSYGVSVGLETMGTAIYIGRCIEAVEHTQGLPMERVFRKTAVTHLCGNSKAGDSHVRQAIIDRWQGDTIALAKTQKCADCRGKGTRRVDRRTTAPCPFCAGTGRVGEEGPLVGVTKDGWAALAVCVYVQEMSGG